jgi:hypothetical protein
MIRSGRFSLEARPSLRSGADVERAKAANEDFLALWKNADPDIPILKKVGSERGGATVTTRRPCRSLAVPQRRGGQACADAAPHAPLGHVRMRQIVLQAFEQFSPQQNTLR